MGGLRKYMPITWITSLIGSLALIGFPGFSGFFSKDSIIEAVHLSTLPGAGMVYWMVVVGVFITALYTFRMYFMVFHGKERMDQHTKEHLHETPWVVTVPLIALAIPSVIIGWMTIEPMLFGSYFNDAIAVKDSHNVLGQIHFTSQFGFIEHAFHGPAVYFAAAGVFAAWYFYMKNPPLADRVKEKFIAVYNLLDRKYWVDEIYFKIFGDGSRAVGKGFWQGGDVRLIDGWIINGSACAVQWFASIVRHMQTGRLYHYAFAMIFGLVVLLALFVKQ